MSSIFLLWNRKQKRWGGDAKAESGRSRLRLIRLILPAACVLAWMAVRMERAIFAAGAVGDTPIYTYHIVQRYPHDPEAFTQGLVYENGEFIEGTGINGRSSLRRVRLETGEVLQRIDLDSRYFGEGVTRFENRVMQLTWQSHVGFVYSWPGLELQETFPYETEGWGLTHDGSELILSDGTSRLYFLDPATLRVAHWIDVREQDQPVTLLNELEYIEGEVYANVWLTDRIARIDPSTGRVTSWIDLSGLLSPDERTGREDVLNGIAYDAGQKRLFVTGKYWPLLFQIELLPVPTDIGDWRIQENGLRIGD